MVKNIAYFPSQAARNAPPVLEAALCGLRHHGITAIENFMDADAALIWSVLWAGRMSRNLEIYQHYHAMGRPVIVIDVGSLHRGITWKIAVDNITSQGFYGHTQDLDWDRPRVLGISLATAIQTRPHVLIAAQNRNSLQVQDLPSMETWVMQQISLLRQHSDRPICIRPHPRCGLALGDLPKHVIVERPCAVTGTYDSFDMRYDCHAVVNYNSGPGVQAALHGVRPLVHSSSLAYPVSVSIHDIEKAYDIDRQRWLVEICHTEYTLDEIRQGAWLKRIGHKLS